jgi:hypothetical protein
MNSPVVADSVEVPIVVVLGTSKPMHSYLRKSWTAKYAAVVEEAAGEATVVDRHAHVPLPRT